MLHLARSVFDLDSGGARRDTAIMRILTIETTCDETAAAVVTDELGVLGSAIASQKKLKGTGVVY